MQEEVNEKTVSLCITGGKVTVRLLKQAMMRKKGSVAYSVCGCILCGE